MVQEGIADRFHAKLKRRMDGLRMGDPLDKCIDVGAIVDPVQLAMIRGMVEGSDGEWVWQPEVGRAACVSVFTTLGIVYILVKESVVFFQTVPIVAIAPMLVIWFGFGPRAVMASAFIVWMLRSHPGQMFLVMRAWAWS